MSSDITKKIDKSLFKNFVKKDNPVILDIGCYDGRDSLELLDIFKNASIYAFEGDTRSIEVFNKTVPENTDIKLIKTILSDVDGEVSWYASDSDTRRHYDSDIQNSWSASSSTKKPTRHLKVFDDVMFYDPVTANSMRLDTWINDNSIDFVDLMWVDVNGGEKEFLEGAINTLKYKTGLLYIEFNVGLYENALSKEEILDFLPMFKKIGTYEFFGNFGNILLKNKSY